MGSSASSFEPDETDRQRLRRQRRSGDTGTLFRRPTRDLEDDLPFPMREARYGPLAAKLAACAADPNAAPSTLLSRVGSSGRRSRCFTPSAQPTSPSLKKESQFDRAGNRRSSLPTGDCGGLPRIPGSMSQDSASLPFEASLSRLPKSMSYGALPSVDCDGRPPRDWAAGGSFGRQVSSNASAACCVAEDVGDDLDATVALQFVNSGSTLPYARSSSNSSGASMGCGAGGGGGLQGHSPPAGISPTSSMCGDAWLGAAESPRLKKVGFKPVWELEEVLR